MRLIRTLVPRSDSGLRLKAAGFSSTTKKRSAPTDISATSWPVEVVTRAAQADDLMVSKVPRCTTSSFSFEANATILPVLRSSTVVSVYPEAPR